MTLKIGIIGLGDIATKAYLPVMAGKNLEVHLFTRNEEKLKTLGSLYRFEHRHQTLESLINSGIRAAFVHTSTGAHLPIVEQLLHNGIHVYVDKPVTYHFETTAKLVSLAEKNGLTLMAGFNRRHAPAYGQLKGMEDINMIVMQKNRKSLPGDVRTFVFDDFIHVIDTLLFLFPRPFDKLTVTGRKKEGALYHTVVQLDASDGTTAIGIMNRDSGTVEERLEVFCSHEKRVVTNVVETTVLRDSHATRLAVSDWESTLNKRGFGQITDNFLERIAKNLSPDRLHRDVLRTHEVCEEIVRRLSAG